MTIDPAPGGSKTYGSPTLLKLPARSPELHVRAPADEETVRLEQHEVPHLGHVTRECLEAVLVAQVPELDEGVLGGGHHHVLALQEADSGHGALNGRKWLSKIVHNLTISMDGQKGLGLLSLSKKN